VLRIHGLLFGGLVNLWFVMPPTGLLLSSSMSFVSNTFSDILSLHSSNRMYHIVIVTVRIVSNYNLHR
jgi:hypothetical protein